MIRWRWRRNEPLMSNLGLFWEKLREKNILGRRYTYTHSENTHYEKQEIWFEWRKKFKLHYISLERRKTKNHEWKMWLNTFMITLMTHLRCHDWGTCRELSFPFSVHSSSVCLFSNVSCYLWLIFHVGFCRQDSLTFFELTRYILCLLIIRRMRLFSGYAARYLN